ncbi:MAG: hypothetical protein RBR86_01930 [Pseudobdellovibrionaceae bacterium]|jgi:hypothetical protein|nr:hypothetical protein [Pseudobdellovibrionaceae bacterium]
MVAATAGVGQQSIAPLTKQLRNESTPDVGLANRDTSKERIQGAQQVSQRVVQANQEPKNQVQLATQGTENSKPQAKTGRGSLVDMTV